MSESVSLPALGESVTEGTVTRWLKKVGDRVEVDEPLLEVSTDKVDTEIPSPVAGVIEAILVAEDETVEVGTALVTIGDGSVPARPRLPPRLRPPRPLPPRGRSRRGRSRRGRSRSRSRRGRSRSEPAPAERARRRGPCPDARAGRAPEAPSTEQPVAAPATRSRRRAAGSDARPLRLLRPLPSRARSRARTRACTGARPGSRSCARRRAGTCALPHLPPRCPARTPAT